MLAFLEELPSAYAAQIQAVMLRVVQMGLAVAGQKRKVEKLRENVWEVRIAYNDRIFRVLFAIHGPSFVALHAFERKGKETPLRDIKTAEDRLADWLSRVPPPR